MDEQPSYQPSQSSPPSQPMIPIPYLPPKKNSGILTGVLLLILGIIFGLLINKTTLLSTIRIPYLSSIPTSSPTPHPETPLADPTEGWKTYTNPSYSFKYPLGLMSDTGAAGVGYESIRYTYIGPAQKKLQTELYDGYAFIVTKLGSTTQRDPKLEAEKQQNNSKDNCENVSSISKTVVGNYSAYQYSAKCLGSSFTNIYISNGNDTYSITQLYTDNMNNYKSVTDQILSTFRFTQSISISSTPTPSLVPSGWKNHTFAQYGVILFAPSNWKSSSEDFPNNQASLIRFWQGSGPETATIQLAIHTSWANTGDAPYLPKNYTVAGTISAVKVDPPRKEDATLDRYQTNVYFEHDSHVYILTCVHNWIPEQYQLCDTMLKSLQFVQ